MPNIEAEKGRGLYPRSDDSGATWTKLDASNYMVWRPFYFGNLIVDPRMKTDFQNPILFCLAEQRWREKPSTWFRAGPMATSTTCGSTRRTRTWSLAGDDGRLVGSEDGGNLWKPPDEPAGFAVLSRQHRQFRSLSRLRRLAGQQFMGRAIVLSGRPWPTRAGRTCLAAMASGCSKTLPIPTTSTPRPGWRDCGGESPTKVRFAQPQTLAELRRKETALNWETPIHMSPNEKRTIYIGAQYLFRSRDQGQSWDRISPTDDERSREAEAGRIGRRAVDNSSARDAHHDLCDFGDLPRRSDPMGRPPMTEMWQIRRDGEPRPGRT